MHAGHTVHYISKFPSEDPFGDWLGPGWYFVDESESRLYGPYDSQEQGERARDVYYDRLSGGVR